jgi:DNA-binding response OmpR family regulator
MNVLVIDDQSWSVPVDDMRTCLGWQVEVVTHPDQLADDYDFNAYDLILLDHRMPVRKGDDVARQIRASSQVPIVCIGSFGSSEGVYPADCLRANKMLSFRRLRILADFARGVLSLEQAQEAVRSY